MSKFQNYLTLILILIELLNSTSGDKKLSRNYASHECGAKVISSNHESEGVSHILSESKDEYMLNPCKAQIWFVVELCEPIQPSSIELANFELFSSTPKELSIYGSDSFPAREWTNLGLHIAADERNLQRFSISPQTEFLKFIKIDMLSHYGSEHYCPLSLIRVYGTSLVEEFDAIENGASNIIEEPVMEDVKTDLPPKLVEVVKPKNILGSAREAVISMVRKAALVLSKGSSEGDIISDSVIADQFMIHQRAMNVMSKIEPNLIRSGCIKYSRNITSENSTEVSRPCLYLESLLGLELYQVLCDELLKEPHLRFKCEIKNEILQISPSKTQTAFQNDITQSISDTTQKVNISELSTNENYSFLPSSSLNVSSSNFGVINDLNLSSFTKDLTVLTNLTNQDIQDNLTNTFDNSSVFEVDNESNINPKGSEQSNNAPSVTTASSNFPNTGSVLAASSSKESIFIKLNNKIKTLEQNMTTNSYTLGELTSRYQEQMLEIQLAFNLTEERFSEATRKADEKDMIQQKIIYSLETKLLDISEKVELLVSEKEYLHWQFIQIHILLIAIEIMLTVIITSYCVRKISRTTIIQPKKDSATQLMTASLSPFKRPNSCDNNAFETEIHSPAKTKRLEMLFSINGNTSKPPLPSLNKASKKKRKKKKKGLLEANYEKSDKPSENFEPPTTTNIQTKEFPNFTMKNPFPLPKDQEKKFKYSDVTAPRNDSVYSSSSSSSGISSVSIQSLASKSIKHKEGVPLKENQNIIFRGNKKTKSNEKFDLDHIVINSLGFECQTPQDEEVYEKKSLKKSPSISSNSSFSFKKLLKISKK